MKAEVLANEGIGIKFREESRFVKTTTKGVINAFILTLGTLAKEMGALNALRY